MKRLHERIRAKIDNPWEPAVLIVAFGDSVTQGMTTLDEQLHDEVYHARFRRMLEARYPRSTFSVINAGVSGQTACGALSLVDRDVIRHQPALTLVGFGLNDAWNGVEGLPDFVGALTALVERIQAETSSDIVLLTPNFMNTKAPGQCDEAERRGFELSAALQNDGTLAAYAQAVRDLASRFALPCADVHAAWTERAGKGVDTDAWLANHMNHPVADAHAVPAALLMDLVRASEPDEPRLAIGT